MLPGLAYVDLVYQFLRGAGHSLAGWELRDLSIYEPLAVSEGKPVLLTVESSLNPDDSLRILIQSKERGGSAVMRRHAIVQARRVSAADFSDTIDIAEIKKSSVAIDVSKIYDRYSSLGLVHGPFMKVAGHVYIAAGAVYADVTLSEEGLAAADDILFSPALLDACAACGGIGLAYANAEVARRLSLPLYFQSFRATAPLQRACTARLRVDSVRKRNEVSYVTLEFFDAQGRKVAELRDLAGTSGLEGARQAAAQQASPAVVENAARISGEEPDLIGARIEQMVSAWFVSNEYPLPANFDSTLSFAELGVDSAGLLGLLREIETWTGGTLSPTLLFEYGNVKELAGYLATLPGAHLDEIQQPKRAHAVVENAAHADGSRHPPEQPYVEAIAHIETFLRKLLVDNEHTWANDVESSLSFAEIGIDSAGLLELLQKLESIIGTALSPVLLFEHGSIKDLATHLAQAHGAFFTVEASIPAQVAAEAAGDAPISTHIDTFLRGQFAGRLGVTPAQLDSETNFSELGFDSVSLLSLLQEIESLVGTGLPATLLFECHNLSQLAEYLALHHASSLDPSVIAARRDTSGRSAPPAKPPKTIEPESASATPHPHPVATHERRRERPESTRRDIAIIGISGRFPGAGTVEALWEVLRSGRDCVTEIPQERWDYKKYRYYEDYCKWGDIGFCHWGGFIDGVDKFDAGFFNIQSLHADCMDPQERLFMQTAWQLLESAGYTRERLKDEHKGRVGVYVGAMHDDYSHIEADISQELGSFLSFHGSIANRVSHFFDLNGPSMAIDTMCSSSAVAIHTACRDINGGDCELAIVGGVNLSLHHKKFIGLSHEKQIGTHQRSRSFADADGYLPAETIAAILLKPLDQAVEGRDHILGVIKSSAVNHSGRSNGYTVPNPTAQAQVIEDCLQKAGVDVRTVSYVEAMSNGSVLGDPIELVALQKVFTKRTQVRQACPIGTVKSNIGHAEAASAMSQLAKVLLQFEHRQLPMSIKTEPHNPLAQWKDTAFHLVQESREWPRPTASIDGKEQCYPRRAILNSFGAGGTNATLLLEEFIEPVTTACAAEPSQQRQIVVFSARTADRLPVMLRELREYLQRHPQTSLADIAYTLQTGREAMKVRFAMVARDRDELLSMLAAGMSCDPRDERTLPAGLPMFLGDNSGASAVKGLIEGKAGKAMIEMLARENDVERLALLWTQGAAIPWRALHVGSSARSVPLPAYPFKEERHWLLERERTTAKDAPAPSHAAQADSVAEPRASLPQQAGYGNFLRGERVAPRNDIERAIAEIWEQALGVPYVGVTDSFFALGGNSLLAGMVIARCSEAFGVEMDWRVLLGEEPTIAGFAVTIVSKLATLQGMDENALETALAD
jgi:3-oxoacyl-(acyl-carrier-protein) synthase/acyl carrier protein